jgi:hypothetical protein
MNDLKLNLQDNVTTYAPGDVIRGRATWQVEKQISSVEVRLFWYTRGKGTQDIGIVQVQRIDNPPSLGDIDFEFTLPAGPYSFSGKLISLIWAIELVMSPGSLSAHVDLVVSPTQSEIMLASVEETK